MNPLFPEFPEDHYQSIRALVNILNLESSKLTNAIIDLPIYRPAAEDQVLCMIEELEDLLESGKLDEKQKKLLNRYIIYQTAANVLLAIPQEISRTVLGVQVRHQTVSQKDKMNEYTKKANGQLEKLADNLGIKVKYETSFSPIVFKTAPGKRGRII